MGYEQAAESGPPGNELTAKIIGAAIEVHRALGPGLLESAYAECLAHELAQTGVRFLRQVPVPLVYKGLKPDAGFRLDLLVEDEVVVELKSVEQLLPVHTAQVLTYLQRSGKRLALLINLNETTLKHGIKRLVI